MRFDMVGVFDILEHIESDDVVLEQIRQSMVQGGGLLIIVPQHRWLWSAVLWMMLPAMLGDTPPGSWNARSGKRVLRFYEVPLSSVYCCH